MKLTKRLLIVLILVVVLIVRTPAWSNEDFLQTTNELKQKVIRPYHQGS